METAQVYVGDPVCSVKRPRRELRNFKKVKLMPGETMRVTLPLTRLDLSYYDETAEDWILEPGEFIISVGSSSRDIRLEGRIDISDAF